VQAQSYLRGATDKASEGLRLGLMFAMVNLVLDLLILVLLFKNGLAYFISLTVWLAYFTLFDCALAGRAFVSEPRVSC
jgi:hypothetical protein